VCAFAVFQILRGSEMLFAALFAVLFLKRHLNRWHFLGVALCMVRLDSVKRETVACVLLFCWSWCLDAVAAQHIMITLGFQRGLCIVSLETMDIDVATKLLSCLVRGCTQRWRGRYCSVQSVVL
jgi:hypothetical protein